MREVDIQSWTLFRREIDTIDAGVQELCAMNQETSRHDGKLRSIKVEEQERCMKSTLLPDVSFVSTQQRSGISQKGDEQKIIAN